MLEGLRVTIKQELNYEREAQNLVTVAKNLAKFELIQVPQPIPEFSTRRVLTMDYFQGRKITSLGAPGEPRTGRRRAGGRAVPRVS